MKRLICIAALVVCASAQAEIVNGVMTDPFSHMMSLCRDDTCRLMLRASLTATYEIGRHDAECDNLIRSRAECNKPIPSGVLDLYKIIGKQ